VSTISAWGTANVTLDVPPPSDALASEWGTANASIEDPTPEGISAWGTANATLTVPAAVPGYWGSPNLFGVTAAAPSDLMVPPSGAWYGGVFATIGTKQSTTTSGLNSWVTAAEQRPHIIGIYKGGAYNGVFTATELSWFDPPGGPHAIPHVRWKIDSGGASWATVASGARNADIDNFCTGISSYPWKVFLTIYHEPEDNVGDMAGMTKADYVAMWQHVRDRVESHNGVTNVVWVLNYVGYSGWAVNGAGKGFEDLYPGDDVVDWIAWDPYTGTNNRPLGLFLNENTANVSGWTGFYNWATSNHPNKPLMLAEFGMGINTGNGGLTNADEQAKLITNFGVGANEYPAIRAWQQWHAVGTRDYQQSPYPVSVSALKGVLALPWFTQDPNAAP